LSVQRQQMEATSGRDNYERPSWFAGASLSRGRAVSFGERAASELWASCARTRGVAASALTRGGGGGGAEGRASAEPGSEMAQISSGPQIGRAARAWRAQLIGRASGGRRVCAPNIERGRLIGRAWPTGGPGGLLASALLLLASLRLVCGAELRLSADGREEEEARATHWSLPNRPSLFSIIRFPNEECFDSSNQSGTCYTAFECKLLGGQPSSPCAAGFGACCIVSRTCHVTTREKVVYFKNPSYPAADSDEKFCDLTVELGEPSVCQLRLDFLDFQLDPPSNGACRDDYMEISASGMPPQTVPRLCGLNRNQHRKYARALAAAPCERAPDARDCAPDCKRRPRSCRGGGGVWQERAEWPRPV